MYDVEFEKFNLNDLDFVKYINGWINDNDNDNKDWKEGTNQNCTFYHIFSTAQLKLNSTWIIVHIYLHRNEIHM